VGVTGCRHHTPKAIGSGSMGVWAQGKFEIRNPKSETNSNAQKINARNGMNCKGGAGTSESWYKRRRRVNSKSEIRNTFD